jgi:hypothetical protein
MSDEARPPAPIPYATPIAGTSSTHDTVYTVLLLVVGFFQLLGILVMIAMLQNPNIAPEGKWVFRMTAYIHTAFLVAIFATAILRFAAPAKRRPFTLALNIILLLLFPHGTALGIYGLWKVDKRVGLV